MIKWKTINKEIAVKSDFLTIVSADAEMPDGTVTKYLYSDRSKPTPITQPGEVG
jgi:hypothetical protein